MSTARQDLGVTVDFCGELFVAEGSGPLTIGRVGHIEIDDNPYLHRNFLQIVEEGGLWWLANVGTTLTATVADKKGLFQAWLNPGARIPLALERLTVWFTAGPTTYDFDILVDSPAFTSTGTEDIGRGRRDRRDDRRAGVLHPGPEAAHRGPRRAVPAPRTDRRRPRSLRRPTPPRGSAGRSRSSTENWTMYARRSPMLVHVDCTGGRGSSRATARRGWSSTRCRPVW